MLPPLNNVFIAIRILEKQVELRLTVPSVQLFIQNVAEMEPRLGFTTYEFSYLIYAAAIKTAEISKKDIGINFEDVYDTVTALKKTDAGQREIERIAKHFMQAEAFKSLIAHYEKKNRGTV